MKVVPIKLWVRKLRRNSFRKLSSLNFPKRSHFTTSFLLFVTVQREFRRKGKVQIMFLTTISFFEAACGRWTRWIKTSPIKRRIHNNLVYLYLKITSRCELLSNKSFTRVTSNLGESRKTDENYRLELSQRSPSVVSVSQFPRIVCAWSKLSILFHTWKKNPQRCNVAIVRDPRMESL